MRTGNPFKLALALCLAIPFALAACGGGGGGGTPAKTAMTPTPTPGGPTKPIDVAIGGIEIASIHLEETDGVAYFPQGGVRHPTTDRPINRSWRAERVCPGVPPRGNECNVVRSQIDGTWFDHSNDVINTAAFATLQQSSLDLWRYTGNSGLGGFDGVPPHPSSKLRGGYAKYMGYYTYWQNHPLRIETFSAAFGQLYSGRPTAAQGSATWRGAMDGATRMNAWPVQGYSRLEYDFSNDTLDLRLYDIIRGVDSDYNGPESFEWSDLRMNADGSFYIPGYGNDKPNTGLHPTLGYVDGDFYGPNAEEFAGVFERQFGNSGDTLIGAFGGLRVGAEGLGPHPPESPEPPTDRPPILY